MMRRVRIITLNGNGIRFRFPEPASSIMDQVL